MEGQNQKAEILKAATELLEEAENPEKVTSRQIAARAGVNLAMINYYFGSKETLISKAISEILDVMSSIFKYSSSPRQAPKEQLRNIFRQISQAVVKYRRYTRLYVPHILLEDEITLPQYVLPEIRDFFGSRKSETECRIIAYEMVSFLQLAFYRSDAFKRYTGFDLSDEKVVLKLIDWELDKFLPDEKGNV